MSKKLLTAVAVGLVTVAWGKDLKSEWEAGKRAETLDWFRREMFGYAPLGRPADEKFEADGVSFADGQLKIRIYCKLPKGASADNPVPALVLVDHYNGDEREDHLWTRPNTPTNAIVGRGYAYVNFNVNDIALNCYDDRWSNKVHRVYGGGKSDSWGTISAWAWGVSRVVDWLESRPEIDATRVGVVGHSRGGKTALWAAAQDERIALAVPNGSGTGGARYMGFPLPKAEPLDWMLDNAIHFWFCPNFQKYKGRSTKIEHDADDLIRLVCPRLVYVGSGSEDDWAGPQGEFEAACRASDLWRAYGLPGLSVDAYPRPGTCANGGRVGYMLRKGEHALTPWNWNCILDFADRHMKRQVCRPQGLQGRTASIFDRLNAEKARQGGSRLLELFAWRGERVHGQCVVWSDLDEKCLRLQSGELVAANGARIPASCLTGRFVRTANTKLHLKDEGTVLIGDCLDVTACEWPPERFRAIWWTVDVPADAKPGVYMGEVRIAGETGSVEFPVALTVGERALPPVKDRKFVLNQWQHPWSVAYYHKVMPFSDEHFRFLEPIYRELAAAGQRSIDTSITDLPWGEDYAFDRGEIRTMVKSFRRVDGSWRYDFSDFDKFVSFAKGCGMGPQIHLYTVVKFNHKHVFYFTDETTGERTAAELEEGTPEHEKFFEPLLRELVSHLKGKGWLEDSYVAIDEVEPERLVAVRAFLKRVAPELKFALASNVDPLRYEKLTDETDVMAQILWAGNGISTLFSKDFERFHDRRRARGQLTTFYVCTEPQHPNTWFKSPLVESEWIGLYAAARRFDGFLRWATFLWGKDPFNHPEGTGYPTGEDFLIYPGGLASVRWEILRDSFEDWEKIRILRETGDASPALEEALSQIDYFAVNSDDERMTRRKVENVLRELSYPTPSCVSRLYRTPGLIGGMGPAATCDLMQKVIDLTDAADDQHHIHMLVDQNTDVPDRTAAILKDGADPMRQLIASAKRLEAAGADFLCMSCNTAHFFHGRLSEHVSIPVLNMPEESARELKRRGVRRVGLLATDGTIRTGVYHKYLKEQGIEVVVPEGEDQKVVMSLIYDCVKKNVAVEMYPKEALARMIARLKSKGAEAYLMACTELPIAFKALGYDEGFVDPTLCLATAIVREAGAPLKGM